jgi:PIN domain nuclease of toxin-antitoxin system
MQRLLLDTHVFLWWLQNNSRLGKRARKLISDPHNVVYVSAVTGWEISIKRESGKLKAPKSLDDAIEESGFLHLPITFFHGEQAGQLMPHHRDPFDRMLIAQAQAEGLTIITGDDNFDLYGIKTINAQEG